MKRWTIAVLALCLVPATLPAGDDDAAIKGLLQRLRKGDAGAVPALVKHGAKAVPGLIEVVKEGDATVQSRAMETLGKIGPAAKAAVPILTEGLNETTNNALANEAAQALGRIGEAGMPVLLKVLENGTPARAAMAARALGHVGPAAKAAEPLLVKQLKATKQPQVQAVLVDALVALGPGARDAVPTLVEVAKANPTSSGINVLMGLGKMGPSAKEAAPYIASVLTDTKLAPYLRVHALESLSKVAPSDKALAEVLPEMVKDVKWPRAKVIPVLARVGPATPEARTALEDAISAKDPLTRVYAAQGLGKGNPKDRAVVSVLIESLKEKDPLVRRQAAIAVGEVRPTDPAVARSLEQATHDADPRVRDAATASLKRLEKK